MQRGAVMDPEMDKMAERGQLSEWRRWLPLVVLAAAIAAFFALGLGRYLTWDAFREHRQSLLDAIARAGAWPRSGSSWSTRRWLPCRCRAAPCSRSPAASCSAHGWAGSVR